jgi:hypothetical protein
MDPSDCAAVAIAIATAIEHRTFCDDYVDLGRDQARGLGLGPAVGGDFTFDPSLCGEP